MRSGRKESGEREPLNKRVHGLLAVMKAVNLFLDCAWRIRRGNVGIPISLKQMFFRILDIGDVLRIESVSSSAIAEGQNLEVENGRSLVQWDKERRDEIAGELLGSLDGIFVERVCHFDGQLGIDRLHWTYSSACATHDHTQRCLKGSV